MEKRKRIKCNACKGTIQSWQHYFAIESNHPEREDSWDMQRAYFHVDCLKKINIIALFDWHILGEY